MKQIKQFIYKCTATIWDDESEICVKWPVQCIWYGSENPDLELISLKLFIKVYEDFPLSSDVNLGNIDLISVVNTNVQCRG